VTTRRRILLALGAGALTAPVVSFGQRARAKVWRVGLFHVGLDHVPPALEGIREGLNALGYQEGRDVTLDFRNLADMNAARATAREFVRDKVDLIVAFENQPIQAAKDATGDIPVIMLNSTDAVADGFVQSLSYPGGNITGFTGTAEMPAKELELLKQLVPRLKRPLLLFAEEDPASLRWLGQVRQAARALQLEPVERHARHASDIERLFAGLKPGEVDSVLICSPHLRLDFHALILEQAVKRRLPLVGFRAGWVERGALFSYSPDFRAVGRQDMAPQIAKILKGVKPADLPVEQISRLQLVVSQKAAKALGITIPQSMLVRADRVIE
jgi:putative tryptophan/tyrosine transport system substrate-binding protein